MAARGLMRETYRCALQKPLRIVGMLRALRESFRKRDVLLSVTGYSRFVHTVKFLLSGLP